MVVKIPIQTAAGPGELVFDMDTESPSAMVGKLTKLEIPDEGLRSRFEHYLAAGNPEVVAKMGGAEIPPDPRNHLDVILTCMARIFDEGIPGFDFVPPEIDTGAPGGDVWRT